MSETKSLYDTQVGEKGRPISDVRPTQTEWETQASENKKVYQFTVPNITSDSQHRIATACIKLTRMLLEKNDKSGDSALNPIRIFSKADTEEQLRVRIDDKLNKLLNRSPDENEDNLFNLIGYLILLWIKASKDT